MQLYVSPMITIVILISTVEPNDPTMSTNLRGNFLYIFLRNP